MVGQVVVLLEWRVLRVWTVWRTWLDCPLCPLPTQSVATHHGTGSSLPLTVTINRRNIQYSQTSIDTVSFSLGHMIQVVIVKQWNHFFFQIWQATISFLCNVRDVINIEKALEWSHGLQSNSLPYFTLLYFT